EKELKEYREALATLTGKTQLEEIDLTPNLGILLTEGNEYEFSLSIPIKPETGLLLAGTLIASKLIPNEDGNQEDFHFSESEIKKWIKEGQLDYHPSAAKLRIHLRVDNLGMVPVDILSIEAYIDEGDAPFYCSSPTPIGKDDKEFAELIPSIKFPITLSPGTIYFCDLISRVSPRGDTSAQFAAGLRDYRAKREYIANLSIDIDAMDSNGAQCSFNQNLKVSSRPLIDLYISEWHELEQSELLRIAGYKSKTT
ncbi:MAG TPA: hypothetical protein VF918_23690, partial [Anaerolineales bacterium]